MFKLITDSSCDLPLAFIEAQDISIMPIAIEIADKSFKDTKDPDQLSKFYQQIRDGEFAKTAQVNMGDFVASFTTYAKEGTPILYIGFSSGMSGTVQAAQQAKDIVLEKFPDAVIHIVDSLGGSGGLGLLVQEAALKRADNWTINTVSEWLLNHRANIYHLFTLTNLEYLVRGGRLSKSSALVGELLRVQPVLGLDLAGKIVNLRKIRSQKKSFAYMVKTALEHVSPTEPINMLITTSDSLSMGEYLKDKILEKLPDAHIEVVHLGATLVSHTGLGTTALFFESDEPRIEKDDLLTALKK
ncbi:DegV family protein [Paucilactobacillus sp. N302-9]